MTTCWKACWMATGASAAQVSGVPEARGVLSNEATWGILHRGVFFYLWLEGESVGTHGRAFPTPADSNNPSLESAEEDSVDEDSKVSAALRAQPCVAHCLSHGGCTSWCFQTPRAVPTPPARNSSLPSTKIPLSKPFSSLVAPAFLPPLSRKPVRMGPSGPPPMDMSLWSGVLEEARLHGQLEGLLTPRGLQQAV